MRCVAPAEPWPIPAKLLFLMCAVILALCGCAHQPMIGAVPANYLWQSGDQFIALVPAEQQPGRVPNDHPASLDRNRLSGVLATLEWQESADAKPVALFTDFETSILAEQIRNGLGKATPGEELVFALVGNHPAFMGLARRPQVTTGRLFYLQGKIHLILGMVHEELGKNEDRRLKPFIPGAREKQASLAGQIVVPPEVGEKRRADWLIINPAVTATKVQPSIGATSAPAIDAVPVASPEPERRSSKAPEKGAKRIEERLILLNGLKEKGLVTDDEYRAKRREILDDL
jgi:hypothetical protein